MMRPLLVCLISAFSVFAVAGDTFTPYTAENVPQNVTELWAGMEVQSEALDTEIVEEWTEEGVTCRYVKFTVCTVKGVPSRIAAFYTFPEGGTELPAFVWAHGGGQRAEKERGIYFAKRGYATVDINWNGREMVEGIEENTDWGKIDPSQGPKFYPDALRKNYKADLKPDEHTIDSVASPRNSNWFLLGYSARRAITFLEQQPEVNAEKIGLTGFSMGGNITSYGAIDPRVKAAIPMVGGTGFLTEPFPGVEGRTASNGHYENKDLFAAANDSAAHWPLVKCPVLYLNATNDFHGIMDRSQACVDLLPHDDWWLSYNPHYNHGLASDQWAMMDRFFDTYLKGETGLVPATPASTFELKPNGTALFTVTPEAANLKSVEIFYSYDPNPQSRFWKTSEMKQVGETWAAGFEVRSNLPLHAFAQVTYSNANGEEIEVLEGTTSTYSITSRVHIHRPEELKMESLRARATHQEVFHDFTTDGLAGWGSGAKRGQIRTYKPQDPDRATPPATASLVLHFDKIEKPFLLQVHAGKNEWLYNNGKKATYVSGKNIPAGEASEVVFSLADFKLQGTEETLADWEGLTTLSTNLLVVEDGKHVSLIDQMAGTTLKKISWR